MRAMEQQQQRHTKQTYIYIYIGSALKSLASDPGNESVSNLSFKSAYTHNAQTQRIDEMITKAVKAKTANNAYYGLSDRDDLDDVSSSHGHVDISNLVHAHGHYGSIRNMNKRLQAKIIGN